MSDLIERDKAINILDRIDVDIIPYADTRKYVMSAIDHIRKELENIPSARPKGDSQKAYDIGFRKGKEAEHRWWSEHCANCGADMRGDKNGNQI